MPPGEVCSTRWPSGWGHLAPAERKGGWGQVRERRREPAAPPAAYPRGGLRAKTGARRVPERRARADAG